MKRLLSIALALSLIAGMMSGLTLTATAETDDYGNTIIESMAITDVTAPVAGQMPTPTASILASNDYAGFYLTSAEWECYDYNAHSWTSHDETTVFAADTIYRIFVNFAAKENYSFGRNLYDGGITVNGAAVDFVGFWGDGANYDNCGMAGLVYLPDSIQLIDNISLTGIPALEAGASTDTSTIAAPAGANYIVSDALWGADDGEGPITVGSTLVDGYCYSLSITLAPKEGYWFADTVTTSDTNADTCYSNDWGCESHMYYTVDLRPIIREVALTYTGTPEADAALSSVSVTAPQGVNYTVECRWETWDSNYGDYVEATGNFAYGEYRLKVYVIPASGYSINLEEAVTINGSSYYELEGWHQEDDDGNYQNGFYLIHYAYIEAENGYIWEVALSGPEKITAGADMTNPTITVVDGNVTVAGTKWVNEEMEPVSGKFENGKSYYLAIELAAKPGYAFDGWINAYMNDENCEGCNVDNSRTTATVYVYYTLKAVIEKVELTVTAPTIGATPGTVTLPSDAKYVFDADESVDFIGYVWYNDNGQDFDKFENGKKYYVDIYLLPAEGYEFARDMVVIINGEEATELYCNGSNLNVWKSWSFKKTITSVNITAPDYKVGDVFNPQDVTIPSDSNCEIGYVDIYFRYADPYTAIGKDRYTLNIELIAKEGYEFSDDCVVTINGKSASDQYGSGELQGVYYEFSLCEKITKVEFPAFPSVSVGDTIEYQILTTPTDANYVAYSDWYDADTNPFNGTIENQNAYYLQYIAEPAQGYEFSEDCVITVGGQVVDGILKRIDSSYLVVVKQYNFGMPVIDKVELTITAPAVGEKPNMTITLPNGVKYTAEDLSWIESKSGSTTGGDWNYVGRTNTFKAGYTYFAICPITAADGYIFAEDAEIYVNGKKVDIVVSQYGSYLLGSQGQLIYNFGELVSDYDDNPKTGVIGISALVAMMALSATAAGVIISKKKEF